MSNNATNIENQIIDIHKIPDFQILAMRVAQEIDKENVSITDLANLISQDIGLASRLLKLANSVLYTRGSGNTASIKDAVNRVGMNETKNICMAVAVRDVFCDNDSKNEFVEQFKHSLSVANICLLIKQFSKPEIVANIQNDILYLAGLMQESGLVIAYSQKPELVKRLSETEFESHRDYVLLEKEILGADHAELSSLALKHWGLPNPTPEIVRYHHNHDQAPKEIKRYAQLIHIADMISIQHGYSDHSGEIIEPFDISAWHDLGLNDDDIPKILEETDNKISKTELFASLSS